MEVFPSSEDLRRWADRLEEVQERLAPYFERAEPRQRAIAYIRGLLSITERKNGWQLAELAGEATPDDEVGRQRGTIVSLDLPRENSPGGITGWPFSNGPFPNRAGYFHSTRLSRPGT